VDLTGFATTATSLATSPGSALRSATREAEVAAVEVVDTGTQEAADPTGFATTATSLATSPGSVPRSATREAEVAAVEVVDTGEEATGMEARPVISATSRVTSLESVRTLRVAAVVVVGAAAVEAAD